MWRWMKSEKGTCVSRDYERLTDGKGDLRMTDATEQSRGGRLGHQAKIATRTINGI